MEAEDIRLVPEGRVGGLLDARLNCLFVASKATDRIDVGSG